MQFRLRFPGPGPQMLDVIFWLIFWLETGLKSESFEPLMDFLRFCVQKLCPNNNTLINYLIRGLINCFVVFRP